MTHPPPIELPPVDIPIEVCDQALGQFMRAWDGLERALFQIFHKLCGADITTARILFDADINLRTLRNVIIELGKHRLPKSEIPKLNALMRRVKNASTKRNRIVHGRWTVWLKMGPPPRPKPLRAESAAWMRVYSPTDHETMDAIMRGRDQKTKANYVFHPNEIAALARVVNRITADIDAFSKPIVLQPPRIPKPIEW